MKPNARQLILMAMTTHAPIISEANTLRNNQGMNGTLNGGRSMFKYNRRRQIAKNR